MAKSKRKIVNVYTEGKAAHQRNVPQYEVGEPFRHLDNLHRVAQGDQECFAASAYQVLCIRRGLYTYIPIDGELVDDGYVVRDAKVVDIVDNFHGEWVSRFSYSAEG